jgi:hypothetical protein
MSMLKSYSLLILHQKTTQRGCCCFLHTLCKKGFHTHYRNRVPGLEGAQTGMGQLQQTIQEIQQLLLRRSAELQQLLAYLVNLCCDDMGLQVTQQLLLPLLAQRLDAAAFAAREAAADAAAAELLSESSSSSSIKGQVGHCALGTCTAVWDLSV